ncbi:MAG: efflux RND transporter periplasmic adaptor subunit [Phycisphaerales bacterium]|nr:efflux RND transporter periplasmic adaptor subunit [Phycisphaerales bacterium]
MTNKRLLCFGLGFLLIIGSACKYKNIRVLPPQTDNLSAILTDTVRQHIIIDTVKLEKLDDAITLTGRVEVDQDNLVKVYPIVGGLVKDLFVQLGDYVHKGQTLATIYSGEIADIQDQLANNKAILKNVEKNLQVTRQLYAANLATDRDVASAEADFNKAQADLNKVIQMNKIFRSENNAEESIVAPISGFIIEKNILKGMEYSLSASSLTDLFSIADIEDVWVMGNVFEVDIAKMHVNDPVDIHVLAYPKKVFKGHIDKIFNILDPDSRVMKVRVKIENEELLLKPEMFASLVVHYQDLDANYVLPAIPSKAIIFDKNKNYVIRYIDSNHVEPIEVEVYKDDNTIAFIKSGLKPGDKVVSKFNQLIFNAFKYLGQ